MTHPASQRYRRGAQRNRKECGASARAHFEEFVLDELGGAGGGVEGERSREEGGEDVIFWYRAVGFEMLTDAVECGLDGFEDAPRPVLKARKGCA